MCTIDNIYENFNYKNKIYIIFSLKNDNYQYIYSIKKDFSNYSLFFGIKIYEKILIKQKEEVDCLECAIGTQMTGGISYDNGDIADFNLNIDFANKIIDQLKNEVQKKYKNVQENMINSIRKFEISKK